MDVCASFQVYCNLSANAFSIPINSYLAVRATLDLTNPDIKFPSKWLAVYSYLATIIGTIGVFTDPIYHVPGMSDIFYRFNITVTTLQYLFMQLFQLTRLHYTFARDSVHSEMGYPNWVFYILFTGSIVSALLWIIPTSIEGDELQSVSHGLGNIVFFSTILFYVFDLANVFLYSWKIRSLNKFAEREPVIYRNIQSILNRIFILTFFYMIVSVSCLSLSFNLSTFLNLSVNTALFLMHDHHSDQYIYFLRFLYRTRLYWCCCCCASMVRKEYMTLETDEGQLVKIGGQKEQSNIVTGMGGFSLDAPPEADVPVDIVCEGDTITEAGAESMSPMSTTSMSPKSPTISPKASRSEQTKFIMRTNDFSIRYKEERRNIPKNSGHFDFGDYLEYWEWNKKNTVMPKYNSLREELMNNRHFVISEEHYDDIEAKCMNILAKYEFTAKHIGAANEKCGIPEGTPMYIEHAIALKVYTDCDDLQREFKRHCRRIYIDEPLESVIERNYEIYHWCRSLKECIMFFGNTMKPKDHVYCGINVPLQFHSVYQRFECALSTTTDLPMAQQFALKGESGNKGIILKLKRANAKTRYFDVEPFTNFENEKEWLIMGSTLKIVDIGLQIKGKLKFFSPVMAAMLMFEQMINGRYVDGNKKARVALRKMLQKTTMKSVTDALRTSNDSDQKQLYISLRDNDYDTDAILEDVEDAERSNITSLMSDGVASDKIANFIQERCDTIQKAFDADGKFTYFWMLFLNLVHNMQTMKNNGTLWMIRSQINKPVFKQHKAALFGDGGDFIGLLNEDDVHWVEEKQWCIDGDIYEEMRRLPHSEYITSELIEFGSIKFGFRFYPKYSQSDVECAIYVVLDELPENLKSVRIEVDMKCDGVKAGKGKKTQLFRQWLKPQILSKENRMCGFKCFEHEKLEENMSLEWTFAVKAFKMEQEKDLMADYEFVKKMFEREIGME